MHGRAMLVVLSIEQAVATRSKSPFSRIVTNGGFKKFRTGLVMGVRTFHEGLLGAALTALASTSSASTALPAQGSLGCIITRQGMGAPCIRISCENNNTYREFL